MAIESFLPPTDVKRTVEKAVKKKPTTEELTTVESPGRPMPASRLERKPYKPRRKAREKTKASNKEVTITQPKKDSILIITEKPQAAMKIASALGKANKYSENKVSFYEVLRGDKKIIVASAVGHLFNLSYIAGQTGWPIYKMEWIPSYKKNPFTRNYYNLLKKLSKRAKEFIIATDYDIEGEVIGWNVLRFIAKQEDAKRMKYSTLTKTELEKSFENSLPTLNWGQAYAGETRHKIDWLYGINLSRALMSAIKKTGSFKILSIGRVQGPTLKIIVNREKEISNFKSKPYWQVFAYLDWKTAGLLEPAEGCRFKHPKDIFKKEELSAFENIKSGEATTRKRKETIEPPHPFDLTTLQRESYNLHRIPPSRTLRIAQSLYLDGLISYPRTSSQKIPDEIKPKEILKKLSKNYEQTKFATRKNPVEGKKSDPAHPSIYPTGEFSSFKDNEEQKIYELIVKRFISAFAQNVKVERKTISIDADGKKFSASGLRVLEKGWTNVYPIKMEERNLPDLKGKVDIEKINFEGKKTQPPKRYTPASLITILEKKSLGTKTTRSLIIEILFDRGYLEGKSIKATPLGLKLIEALEKYSPIIIDENLTRDLEEKMEDILTGSSGFKEKEEKIIKNVEILIGDISKEFKVHEIEIGRSLLEGTEQLREMQRENNKIMPCPVCNKGSLTIKYSKKTRKQFVACDQYPDCTATYNLPPNALIKKTDKTTPEGLPILMAIRKGKRPWEFPFDPNWKEKQEKKTEK
ncbi:MAG: DNA topoisomerase I [Nanoarchaeota archaeon]|nr:DNA topoisomerase I [Nanoarchaeota archaeon]